MSFMNIFKGLFYFYGVIFYIFVKRFFCFYKIDKYVVYQIIGSEFFNMVGFMKVNYKLVF